MKTRIEQLQAKQDALGAQMKAIHDAAGDNPLSAEQQKTWDDLNAQREITKASVKSATIQAEIDREAVAVTSVPPAVVVGKDRETEKPWAQSGGLGGFLQAVRIAEQGVVDPRLMKAAATGGGEAVGPDGGYAIPMEYAAGIEKTMWESGQILSRVDDVPINGNAITYNVISETSRTDGNRRGAILGYWLDEGNAPTASQVKLARVEMKLRKVGALGYLSDELVADASAMQGELTGAFAEELTFLTENSVVNGPGVTQPQGWLNAPCLVSVTKETNQPAATINTTNLSKMWARLPARSKASAAWFINVDCEPQLDELTIPAGTAAVEPRFVNYGPTGLLTIKGRPVIPVEYAATVGTVGDISLIDLSQYKMIRKAAGVQQDSSIHVRFLNDETTFRAIYRVDGQMMPRAAITPFKGSNTLSPAVVLATRS